MRFTTTAELGGRTATGFAVPDELVVPEDLTAALDAAPPVRAAFDALSDSNRRRHVLSVEGAKTEATRQRRIATVVEDLNPQDT